MISENSLIGFNDRETNWKLFQKRCLARVLDYIAYTLFFVLLVRALKELSPTLRHFWETESYQAAISNLSFCFLFYPLVEASGGSPGKRAWAFGPCAPEM